MRPEELVVFYEKYLIGDIDAMMEKAEQEIGGNQMAVPITFSIFSCLDILGFLMRNEEFEKSKWSVEFKKNNTLNIAYSMLKWNQFGFPEHDMQIVLNKTDNYQLFNFIDIYRHGIIHTFFPKYFSLSNIKEDELRELFYKIDINLVFNVRKFYFCFKEFILRFKEELISNEVFNIQVKRNTNLWINIDNNFDDFKKGILNIEKFNLNFPVTTTYETTHPPKSLKSNVDDKNSLNKAQNIIISK